jgi:hypothetical protein
MLDAIPHVCGHDTEMSTNEDHSDEAPTTFGKDVRTWTSRPGKFLARTHRKIAYRSSPGTASTLGLIAGGVAVAVSTAAAITIYDDVTGRFGVQRLDAPALRLGKRLRSPAANTAAGTIVVTAHRLHLTATRRTKEASPENPSATPPIR